MRLDDSLCAILDHRGNVSPRFPTCANQRTLAAWTFDLLTHSVKGPFRRARVCCVSWRMTRPLTGSSDADRLVQLQNGGAQCYCADRFGSHGQAATTDCTATCTGSGRGRCGLLGSTIRISVYDLALADLPCTEGEERTLQAGFTLNSHTCIHSIGQWALKRPFHLEKDERATHPA